MWTTDFAEPAGNPTGNGPGCICARRKNRVMSTPAAVGSVIRHLDHTCPPIFLVDMQSIRG